VTDMSPEEIVDEVRRSGLRGRGGAGFATHAKWDLVRKAASDTKYIICNGDEGDPGAFMDRMILESFPYRVIEGMAIAARAVGAQEGFFYIRAEYPEAVRRITSAIERCRDHGFLGDAILGSDFNLHLVVKQGAGAFICGEETALIHSLEGKRGMPRIRPPFPTDEGFMGRPSMISNVETFANVPMILEEGAAAYAAVGTENSKGTKLFSVSGDVAEPGVYELVLGSSLKELVVDFCGAETIKMVQVGGSTGGVIPGSMISTPLSPDCRRWRGRGRYRL